MVPSVSMKKKPLFILNSPFPPAGDQPAAIEKLVAGRPGKTTLLGVTGSGKTFTMANVIAAQDKPVLVLAPNKTLAAQLYEEFCLFFPQNKVCYFVSYYDYYQPESYLPAQDIYIPKETRVNSEIERLRIEATASLINRPDTIVIASVSCIYSLGNPTDYRELTIPLAVGQTIGRTELINKLVFIQYKRNDTVRDNGTFQVIGSTIEVVLPYQKETLRIELFGSKVERLEWIDRLNRVTIMELDNTLIFPAKHFVTTQEKKDSAVVRIKKDLADWQAQVANQVVRDRIVQRVSYDIEMIEQTGYCNGIENYSSYFDGRTPGQAPFCLLDFFPKDFLLIIDESHITVSQFRGMYAGDRARKKSLIEYGFRLPSAYDNRPLMFEEVEQYFNDVVFVSATPGDYELSHSNQIVEQIIRPTGLVDPPVLIHPREKQLDHLIEQIRATTAQGFRSLVMVMTKKLAEELAEYLEERHIKVCYLHSELKTPQRTELLHKLRIGEFDCLVGVNLLREGLDLPEVALVAIMDADSESFLRDKRSLIQIIGRAARNMDAKVFLYADRITQSMRFAMEETERRRLLQQQYNTVHSISPKSVIREVTKSIAPLQSAIAAASKRNKKRELDKNKAESTQQESHSYLIELEQQMIQAAEAFDFERAIQLRQEWQELQKKTVKLNAK